jgi:hypothetical protein
MHTCVGCSTGSAGVTASGGYPPYQYSWSNGSSQQNITNLAEGCYTVTVTDAASCVVQDTACVQGLTGINEAESSWPGLYPNPAQDALVVELPGAFHISLYNSLGQKIAEKAVDNRLTLDVSLYSRGTYIVMISNGIHLFHRKLLLE